MNQVKHRFCLGWVLAAIFPWISAGLLVAITDMRAGESHRRGSPIHWREATIERLSIGVILLSTAARQLP